MSQIHNTTRAMREDPAERLLALAVSMGPGGSGRFIEEQEAAGQAQLVNSDQLPTTLNGGSDADFEAVGFVLGDPLPGDPMFRDAKLPAGWKRERTDHSMWSKIVDQLGRERVSIFYKAAFYGRDAFMSLTTPYGYVWKRLQNGQKPVLDDEWLTAAVAKEALEKIATRADKEATEADEFAGRNDPTYWDKRAKEHRIEAAKARRMAASL
jgi:hypothetical protein